MRIKTKHILRFLVIFSLICAIALFAFAGCSTSTDWVRKTIEKNYYRFDGDYSSLSDLDGLSIEEMVAKLDRYSAYYKPEVYAAVTADNAGSKSGIGISYVFVGGVGAVLHSVVGNSPARRAGLKAGDVIVSGSVGEITVEFADGNDFSNFMSARETGEEFTVYLESGESATLAKAHYTASYASMYTNELTYEVEYENGKGRVVPAYGGIPQLPAGTAYIYLSQFYGGAAEEVQSLISIFNLLQYRTLILDLRDNGGGYVDLMAKIGGMFTSPINSKAVAMKARYKSGREDVEYCYNYSKNVVPVDTEVYVMANHNTASASEALIGVLVSYNILQYENIFLSKYEGYEAKTYGKGIMQRTFENSLTGEALKLTVAGIYWANGVTIHDRGLTVADGCVAVPASDNIVNIGYDDELLPVIEKIIASRAEN